MFTRCFWIWKSIYNIKYDKNQENLFLIILNNNKFIFTFAES